MIRREIHLPNQSKQWLLVSQIEHARISGMLAEQCQSHFAEAIRSELMQAILHHDDGWAEWEAAPQLDERGRPLSFRELPLEDSLPIWAASVNVAKHIGPLAAWLVASHFLALLGNTDKEVSQVAKDWRSDFESRSAQWLAEWQSASPTENTHALATEGLHWLQLFDVMSLWLCSVCPGQGEQVLEAPESYRVGEGQPVETVFSYESGTVRIDPWRFDVSSLQTQASGWVLPAAGLRNSEQLLAERVEHSVCWALVGN